MMGNCLSCICHKKKHKGKARKDDTERTQQNGDKKRRDKKPVINDSSTDSSGNSSDSDVHSRKVHKSKKYKRSKNGSIVMINNKTTVGGDIITIKGDGSKVVNVNLGDRSARRKERNERRYYDSNETERDQPTFRFSKMSRNYKTPNLPGCFLQIEDHRVTVLDQQTLLAVEKSVGKIYADNYCATCFRVGSNYVMTANHVAMDIANGYITLGSTRPADFAALESDNVYVDFGFLSNTNAGVAENIFYLTSNVVFHDEDLDIAVIELKPGQEYPPPFLNFSQATPGSKFTFVGHPSGEPKQLNAVDGLVQKDEQTKRQAVEWSRRVAADSDGFAGIDIPGRILFHCSFQKGGSGSPGIAVVGGQAVVVTVLLHGYPDWYYDPNVDQRIKNSVGNQQRVEQGVDMKSLYFKMHSVDRDLCCAIFGANA